MAAISGDLRGATLTLNATTIDALSVTAQTIVPAPGVGRLVRPLLMVVRLTRGTTAWTAASELRARWIGDTTNLLQALSIPFNATNGTALDRFLYAFQSNSYSGANNFNPSNRGIEVFLGTNTDTGAADTVLKVFMVYEHNVRLY